MTPEDVTRFREWQIGRGYAAATAEARARTVRKLRDHGVVGLDDVDALFPNYRQTTRSVYRNALRAYDDFLQAVA